MSSMPLIAQVVTAVAIIVIAAEFVIVFRRRRDRKIMEKLNNSNRKEQ